MTINSFDSFDIVDLRKGATIFLDHPELNDLIQKTAKDREEWNRMRSIIKIYSSRSGKDNPFSFFDQFVTSQEFSRLLTSGTLEEVNAYKDKIQKFFTSCGGSHKAVKDEYKKNYNLLKKNESNLGLKTTENPISLNIRSLRCEIAFCLMLGVSFKHCLVIREEINAMSKSTKIIDRGDLVYNEFLFDVKCVEHENKNLLVTTNKQNTDIDFFVLMCDNPTKQGISFLGCRPKAALNWNNNLTTTVKVKIDNNNETEYQKSLGPGFHRSELRDMFYSFLELKNLQMTLTYVTNERAKVVSSMFLKNPNWIRDFTFDVSKINALITSELKEIEQNIMSGENSDPNCHILGCYASEFFSTVNGVTNGIQNLLKLGSFKEYYKYFYEIDNFETFIDKCKKLERKRKVLQSQKEMNGSSLFDFADINYDDNNDLWH